MLMRGRLDSGMKDNAISEEKAQETGISFEPYTGREIIEGSGGVFRPLGNIELSFHVEGSQAAKTWKARFLIFPNPPFDLAFGRDFIYKNKFFQLDSTEVTFGGASRNRSYDLCILHHPSSR